MHTKVAMTSGIPKSTSTLVSSSSNWNTDTSSPIKIAMHTRKIPKNHSTTFKGDTGKSPMKRPVWPFMANR